METKWQPPKRKSIKRKLKNLKNSLTDTLMDIVNPDPMRPPRSMLRVSRTAYRQEGQHFKEIFIRYANLQPDHKVLDVGCGTGRMAVPLTQYLSENGQYWGLDIQKEAIQWCQEHISSKYKQFHFVDCQVYNKRYNPGNNVQAREYKFPFEDAFFDLVFLVSVFSHMLPPDMENYLGEIARVLKPGGTCIITYFLYDQKTQEQFSRGGSLLDFRYKGENYLTSDPDTPEVAVAYDKTYIEKQYSSKKLQITHTLREPAMPGKLIFLTEQDIVVANRKV